MRRRGVSLLELVLYMALLVILGSLVARMTFANIRGMEKPAASFRVQQNLLAVQRMLQRDLEETDISTVRIYPNPQHPDEPPGLSLASARALGGPQGDRLMFQNGLPLWQKFVYYTLKPDPGHPGVGTLLRREGPLATPATTLPPASALPPSSAPAQRQAVAARFLCLPGASIPELPLRLDSQGGFKVEFVDAWGHTSLTDFRRHPLVSVTLASEEISQTTGKRTFITYKMTVLPQN